MRRAADGEQQGRQQAQPASIGAKSHDRRFSPLPDAPQTQSGERKPQPSRQERFGWSPAEQSSQAQPRLRALRIARNGSIPGTRRLSGSLESVQAGPLHGTQPEFTVVQFRGTGRRIIVCDRRIRVAATDVRLAHGFDRSRASACGDGALFFARWTKAGM
jgi:hypothetical protein